MAQNQMTVAQMQQNNLQARQILLASAPRQSKYLGAFTAPAPFLGQSIRAKLYNVGIITKLLMKVTANVTLGAVTAGVLSENGPYNIIKRVRLTDFDGTDRVNVSGTELFMINSVRRNTYAGYNNEAAGAVLADPATFTTAGGTGNITFFMEVPLAYDPERDLRGAIMAQTSVGELALNIDFNASAYASGDDDAIYKTAASVTVNSIVVDLYQDYLLPQNIGGQIIFPQLDLLTVYELAGTTQSSDNLAQNTEKLINIPNVRSVIGAYVRFKNGALQAAATSDVSQVRLIANGNNVLHERKADAQLWEQRTLLNSDTRKGWLFWPFRSKPLETSLYGNVQLGVTPSAAINANAYMGFCFESFYTKGSTLPGMSQSS